MRIDENEDWIDGFDTWEEVWPCLTDDWARVVDVRQRLEVEREVDDLVVVEVDRGLRARQRRELHRLGFRPVSSVRVTLWRWEAAEAARNVDPAGFRHPLLPEGVDPADLPRSYELLRVRWITEELINQQAQRVVREVFQSSPSEVAVVVHRESDVWEDEWEEDEGWQCSTG